MPKRDDIRKVLITGSGPIRIGRAGEFDCSGTQACKAMKSLGYEVVLVNSNSASIMTDPQLCDATYIEPLNAQRLTQIIEKERPDALLPSFGGQQGLNLCMELAASGVLMKYGVQVIGVQVEAVEKGEDRAAFRKAMDQLGIETARSRYVNSVPQALEAAQHLGYPVMVRPAYATGCAGGLVYNREELTLAVLKGIASSMVGQVLVEESVLDWEELELEVLRDRKNQIINVCGIENIDPMGVHTGDSICVAPMLTIPKELGRALELWARMIAEEIGVVGSCSCRFAYSPASGKAIVVEINPRISHSTALASKASGLPIAYVSALLAVGITLDEIPYGMGGGLHQYRYQQHCVAVKYPRWCFDVFESLPDRLGTSMKSIGEVVGMGATYEEALQKAVCSLEIGRCGLGYARDYHERPLQELLNLLQFPTSQRTFILYEALRKGADVDQLSELTKISRWFLHRLQELVELEEQILPLGRNLTDVLLAQAKQAGFADEYLSSLTGLQEEDIRARRSRLRIAPHWQAVPTSGVPGAGCRYSTYHDAEDALLRTLHPKVMILGSGPNRIGQSVEFDYCCTHAASTLRQMGIETILVNSNPNAACVDYDTVDRLYVEPITLEHIRSIYEKEQPLGVIVQFGGQSALELCAQLEQVGMRVLGSNAQTVELMRELPRFRRLLKRLGIPVLKSEMAVNADQALLAAMSMGYPLMVHPFHSHEGKGVKIVEDDAALLRYMQSAGEISAKQPILIDCMAGDALQCEVDAVCDGEQVFIPAVMEQIELAGVHSGDCACMIPPVSISAAQLDSLHRYTALLARELGIQGLLNLQFAISGEDIYILQAAPRASRTVPFVEKMSAQPLVQLATRIITREITGQSCRLEALQAKVARFYGVKEVVFPFDSFSEVDPLLGPRMRSTGEVMGMADSLGKAVSKANEAIQSPLPAGGTAFLSIAQADRPAAQELARELSSMGFSIAADSDTAVYLACQNIACRVVPGPQEGRPNLADLVINGQVDFIVATSSRAQEQQGSDFRKAAIRYNLPYATTMAAARALVKGIFEAASVGQISIKSLQEYYRDME